MTKFPLKFRKRLRDALNLGRDRASRDLSGLSSALSKDGVYPIASCHGKTDWDRFCASAFFNRIQREVARILADHKHEDKWSITGYSIPAGSVVNIHVDMLARISHRMGLVFRDPTIIAQ